MGAVSSIVGAVTGVVNDVVKTVDNTVQSIEKNPITAIADIAAVASGNPELVQYINPSIAIAQGADPTKVALSALEGYGIGQIASGVASDVTDGSTDPTSVLEGKTASGATSGALRAALSGGNPLTGALSGAINTAANTELKNETGANWLPSFNVAGELLGSKNSKTNSVNPSATTTTGATPVSQLASSTTMPDLALKNLTLGNLGLTNLNLQSPTLQNLAENPNMYQPTTKTATTSPTQMAQIYASIEPNNTATMKNGGLAHFASGGGLSTLKVPTISNLDTYTQIDPTLDPTEDLVYNNRLVTPQQMGLLATQPVIFSADGGSIENQSTQTVDYSQIVPELLELLQQHTQNKAGGGTVDNKELQDMIAPKFGQPLSPTIFRSQARPIPPHIGQLSQIAESPHAGDQLVQLGQLPTHVQTRAHGGALKHYKNAAPEGHHPEFITGVTGYYAHGGGTGQSDDIPAMLHDGDYVADADLVAALGDGSSKAGAQALEHFRRSVPHHEGAGGHPVPAQIADGEYVFPANFVTAIGHGDNKAGAKLLDKMREEVRAHKRSVPDDKIPPKAKSPLEYLKMAMKG